MRPAAMARIALALAIAGAAIWLAFNRDRFDLAEVETMVANAGAWAPVGHVVVFAIGTVLFLPGTLFGLAGGALFGPVWGTVLNLAGATLGATAAFLIARHVAADWARRQAGNRLQRLIAGVEAEGWRFVVLTRLVPLVPFNLLNYALGLTRIPVTHYALASLVSMAPGTLAFTWLGYAGREAAGGDATAIRYGLLGLALLAVIAFLPRLVRRLRGGATTPRWIDNRELAGSGGELTVIDVRGPDEFDGPLGHIAGAVNLPLGELPGRLSEINAAKDDTVILVCRTDKRSAAAASLLREAGYRDVMVLRGGMERWNQQGFAIERRVA
ncbi:MAG: VTT domain-containing protein [Alphaproteobacteria bacterium]